MSKPLADNSSLAMASWCPFCMRPQVLFTSITSWDGIFVCKLNLHTLAGLRCIHSFSKRVLVFGILFSTTPQIYLHVKSYRRYVHWSLINPLN